MLKVVAIVLFAAWAAAIAAGKGGLYHIILLNAIGISFVEFLTVLRGRLQA
ncbi:MAG: hypothetical protein KF881_00570 [Acidobacteria bacterium]|nr:hypothetical protein [Acidobacteriota bacterium]